MESREIYRTGKLLMEISGKKPENLPAPSRILFEYSAKDIPRVSLIFESCLLSLARCVYDDSFEFFSSGKDLYTVIFNASGELSVATGRGSFLLREGEIMFARDTENYRIEKNGTLPADVTVMRCTGALPRGYYEIMGKNVLAPLSADSETFPAVFDRLYYVSGLPGTERYVCISSALSLLFFEIFKCRSAKTGADANCPGWIAEVIAYAKAEYPNQITPSDMAERSGMSASSFYSNFRSCTGKTPLQYLTWLRIEKAKTLLSTTDFQVKYISQSVGFQGCSRFIEHFRRVTGSTPEEYRKKSRTI
ncbi:MAG: helix-turn-helix transcriptional regulator [Clostridia bacterium]|nr:helix-turn-helix transcriptional regulator [Clostridia bacterium]